MQCSNYINTVYVFDGKENDLDAVLEMLALVDSFFDSDESAIEAWWLAPQDNLEGKSPFEATYAHHGQRLHDLVSAL